VAISFEPDFLNSYQIRAFDSFVDLIFITDIIIRFRTTYIDPISGEEVMDYQLIAKKYLFSITFVIDVLSTLPMEILFGGSDEKLNLFLRTFGILKLIRILRIGSVIMNLNMS